MNYVDLISQLSQRIEEMGGLAGPGTPERGFVTVALEALLNGDTEEAISAALHADGARAVSE